MATFLGFFLRSSISSNTPCDRCLLRQDLCICPFAPTLSAKAKDLRLLLLTHIDETRKITNTGRLLEAALPSCDLWLWQRKEFQARWQHFLESQTRTPVLLFPEQDSSVEPVIRLDQLTAETEKQRLRVNHIYVLMDATWQQAKKMLRQSPSLQSCVRLPLSLTTESLYTLRRNQNAGHFSTAESGSGLMRALGLETDADSIDLYFHRFLRHSEAHRSGYSLNETEKQERG